MAVFFAVIFGSGHEIEKWPAHSVRLLRRMEEIEKKGEDEIGRGREEKERKRRGVRLRSDLDSGMTGRHLY